MINTVQLLASLAFLQSLTAALPVKREIVTRWHTAPTHTNTDVYSTSDRIHVAPTVAYVVNDATTYTTTLVPPGVDSTVQPSTSTMYGTTPSVSGLQSSSSQAPTSSSSSWSSPVSSSSYQATSSSNQWSSSPTSSQWSSQTSSNQWSSTSSSQWSSSPTSLSQQWTSSAAPSSSGSSSSLAPSSSSSSTSGSGGLSSVPTAVSYSPYNNDGSCKSSDQVNDDLQKIQSKGISRVRVYGTDCGAFENVLPAAAKNGMKVNQGLWIEQSGVDSIDDALQSLIQYGQQNGWDVFDFITVGNEAVNSGYCSASDLISKIKSVKGNLNNAGYQGSIITSEPPVTFERSPELCKDSGIDFVGVNPHSFFDSGIGASYAGQFVKGQVSLAQAACGDMKIFVTETGYPSQGNNNGNEDPSEENQKAAINSILNELNNDVTILSFFDDKWKNPGPYGIEQWFGIEGQLN